MRRHISLLVIVVFAALVLGCGTDKAALAANQGEFKPSPEFVKAVRDFASGDKTALERMKKNARTFNERKLVFVQHPTIDTARMLLELATADNALDISSAWADACERNRYNFPDRKSVAATIYQKLLPIAEADNSAAIWEAVGVVAYSVSSDAYSYV